MLPRPLEQMLQRIERDRQESDTAYLLALLYTGECVTKFVVAALVAAIRSDPEKHRYQQIFRLARAESIGDWSQVLDTVLTGPAAQFLVDSAKEERNQLGQRARPGSWQYDSVKLLVDVIGMLPSTSAPMLGQTTAASVWFSNFAELRNKTRGHGAIPASLAGSLCVPLHESLGILMDNLATLRRPFAHLKRNLSGKYRVISLGGEQACFEQFKTNAKLVAKDGVYAGFDGPVRMELIHANQEGTEFYFFNGKYNGESCQCLCYESGDSISVDASEYRLEPRFLPTSNTGAKGELLITNKVFSNLPPLRSIHITRTDLERTLEEILTHDRHEIVSLTGPGGIGKTTLALRVCHALTFSERFEMIFWLSARDVDLLLTGPKVVKPDAVTLGGFALAYAKALQPDTPWKESTALAFFAENLNSTGQGPTLFVLDNLETADRPADVYAWIDSRIRSPHKVLITTRVRDFGGDKPIPVPGMTDEEQDRLIDNFADYLQVGAIVTAELRDDLKRESEGHPYVLKIMLGEVAKTRKALTPSRVMANKSDILQALFERTYSALTPGARRVFLTLAKWRSVVLRSAVEAVVLRSGNERIDVEGAVTELQMSSLIEIVKEDPEEVEYLSVPRTASAFGAKKLNVSDDRAAVDADLEILQLFGPIQKLELRGQTDSRIQRMLANAAKQVQSAKVALPTLLPVLELIATKHPIAWKTLAEFHAESGDVDAARNALERLLESPGHGSDVEGWERLAALRGQVGDRVGEIHALVAAAELEGIPTFRISDLANRVNRILKDRNSVSLGAEEKEKLLERVVAVLERRFKSLDATACSRLAWLHVHLKNWERALHVAQRGLELEPENEHCKKIADRLDRDTRAGV